MDELLARAGNPIVPATLFIRRVTYLRILQMAMFPSNAIASRIADSAQETRMKNTWVMQASKEISPALSQKMACVLGTVAVDSSRSAMARTGRKRHLGSWRLFYVSLMKDSVKFPRTGAMYLSVKGVEIQRWDSPVPGMPIRTQGMGAKGHATAS